MQFDDDLQMGTAYAGGPTYPGLQATNDVSGSSPQTRGVGPLGRIFNYDQVPVAVATANLAALQTPAAAGNLVLTAAAGVTQVTLPTGQVVYQFDIPRAVSFTSAGNDSAVTLTVSGYDVYGQPMTATVAGPNVNTVNTLKAFYQVSNIAISAAPGTALSAGSSDVFGLPLVVSDGGYIVHAGWAGSFALDTGTFVKADATAPATAATGDVRGTYRPTSASDGVKRLVLSLACNGGVCGPRATRVGAFGVNQA